MCFQSTSSERADAEADSNGSEAASECTAPISDFDVYWNSLHSTVAAVESAMASTKSDLTAFAEALVDVEWLGRLKLPNVWDIISKYLLIEQPVLQIISSLPCMQVSIDHMFSHLKLVLLENKIQMGNKLTDTIVFLQANKSV